MIPVCLFSLHVFLSMTYCLPPNLLALFTPREPIPFLAPIAKLPHEKKREHQGGIAQLVNLFEVEIFLMFIKHRFFLV